MMEAPDSSTGAAQEPEIKDIAPQADANFDEFYTEVRRILADVDFIR